MAGKGRTHIYDLPEPILSQVLALVADVRSRNAVALVCRKWRSLERRTWTSLSLRGHVLSPFLLPTCFPSVSHLDLSLLSPWGHHPFLHPTPTRINGHPHPNNYNGHRHLLVADDQQQLVAQRLGQAFPNMTSLTVYARDPSTLQVLAPQWPGLRQAKLVWWHQRPLQKLGADLAPLLAVCPSLANGQWPMGVVIFQSPPTVAIVKQPTSAFRPAPMLTVKPKSLLGVVILAFTPPTQNSLVGHPFPTNLFF